MWPWIFFFNLNDIITHRTIYSIHIIFAMHWTRYHHSPFDVFGIYVRSGQQSNETKLETINPLTFNETETSQDHVWFHCVNPWCITELCGVYFLRNICPLVHLLLLFVNDPFQFFTFVLIFPCMLFPHRRVQSIRATNLKAKIRIS